MAFNLSKLFSEETIEITPEEIEKVNLQHEDDNLDDSFKLEPNEKEKKQVTRSVVRVYTPVTKAIVPTIITSIKRGELVIVNFSSLSEEEAKYTYATLSGSIYSLDGELKTISPDVMLCAPQKYLVDSDDSE